MILISNWKMNPVSLTSAKQLLNSLIKLQTTNYKLPTKLWFAPPAIFLHPLIQEFGRDFTFGLQNIFWQKQGAFTGEISPLQAKDIDVKFVILGHSERRRMGESLELINKKMLACLKYKLQVVLCFGELTKPQGLKSAQSEWNRQAKILFSRLPASADKIYLAFEPAWAISTAGAGAVSKEYLQAFIDWFAQKVKKRFANIKLLYGGSVEAAVAAQFVQAELEGFLIGSASLQLSEMKKIIKIIRSKDV